MGVAGAEDETAASSGWPAREQRKIVIRIFMKSPHKLQYVTHEPSETCSKSEHIIWTRPVAQLFLTLLQRIGR